MHGEAFSAFHLFGIPDLRSLTFYRNLDTQLICCLNERNFVGYLKITNAIKKSCVNFLLLDCRSCLNRRPYYCFVDPYKKVRVGMTKPMKTHKAVRYISLVFILVVVATMV